MPAELEAKLKAEAARKGLGAKAAGAYIYGSMQRATTWKPGKKGTIYGKTAEGHVTKNESE